MSQPQYPPHSEQPHPGQPSSFESGSGTGGYPPPPGGPVHPAGEGLQRGPYDGPGQPGHGPAPKKKKSALKIVLISLAAVLLLCVGGIAVTAFLAKDKVAEVVDAAKTKVVEPETLAGRAKATDPTLVSKTSELKQLMGTVPGSTGSVGAFYGDPAKQDLVMMAAASSIVGTPQSKLDEFLSGLQSGGFDTAAMKDINPGPLGGLAKCGDSKQGGVATAICVWSDNGSLGMISMSFKKVADLEKEFVTMRGEIEQRA